MITATQATLSFQENPAGILLALKSYLLARKGETTDREVAVLDFFHAIHWFDNVRHLSKEDPTRKGMYLS